jgi:hypothetical protein
VIDPVLSDKQVNNHKDHPDGVVTKDKEVFTAAKLQMLYK